ncbi:copper amine oxidase N-terminal domain-containing protein [Saccharibacillus sp. JS10]|uniref:copper amine oxidase N-terminal domain-containing protein n=1 Tax=Saccharibacillus sp. JS10 TaxID=2950552 RepID=UPI00210EFC65|nr:copper amine oxidase N-terminal domain-containing protein [Saccharibacillus sp. JS10]MCQ4088271.1 copper amine oxidase N-terminal domain-containing protein [Saccharibacillus sp. JS10]
MKTTKMMKSKKWFAATMVAGMALSASVGAYAASNVETIKAQLNHGLGFVVNGQAYTPKDAAGKSLDPIVYKNTTYLPVRALGEALDVPVTYDAAGQKVIVGTKNNTNNPGTPGGQQTGLTTITYTAAQKAAAKQAFAQFQGFEAAYAPMQMTTNDQFRSVAAGGDSVTYVFNNMKVAIAPRDDSFGYDLTPVTLSNGVKGNWYKPGDQNMLTFPVGDRFVTIWSDNGSLTKTQIEAVAVHVEKASF